MPWWLGNNQWSYSGFPWKGFFPAIIIPLVLWSIVWKGLALYKAARNEQKGWFVALLLINTAGILEIIYLLFFSEVKSSAQKKHS